MRINRGLLRASFGEENLLPNVVLKLLRLYLQLLLLTVGAKRSWRALYVSD